MSGTPPAAPVAVLAPVTRRPAGRGGPAGDEFWDGYQPRAVLLPFDVPADDGRVLTRAGLAAAHLDGLPPVSHPAWCDPARCEVIERGTVHHRRIVGWVTSAQPDPDSGVEVTVELERFDNIDDGEWVSVPGHEVVVATQRFGWPAAAIDPVTWLSGPVAGRLGELLTRAAGLVSTRWPESGGG